VARLANPYWQGKKQGDERVIKGPAEDHFRHKDTFCSPLVSQLVSGTLLICHLSGVLGF
jgi:hypothetical protein